MHEFPKNGFFVISHQGSQAVCNLTQALVSSKKRSTLGTLFGWVKCWATGRSRTCKVRHEVVDNRGQQAIDLACVDKGKRKRVNTQRGVCYHLFHFVLSLLKMCTRYFL